MQDAITIDGLTLTARQVVLVARFGHRVSLSVDAMKRMAVARGVVERVIARGDRVYGVTTSVGAKTGVAIHPDRIAEFNRRLLLTHNFGHGPVATPEMVRAMMTILLNSMASGRLGVRPILATHFTALALDERAHVGYLERGEKNLPVDAQASAYFAQADLVRRFKP